MATAVAALRSRSAEGFRPAQQPREPNFRPQGLGVELDCFARQRLGLGLVMQPRGRNTARGPDFALEDWVTVAPAARCPSDRQTFLAGAGRLPARASNPPRCHRAPARRAPRAGPIGRRRAADTPQPDVLAERDLAALRGSCCSSLFLRPPPGAPGDA